MASELARPLGEQSTNYKIPDPGEDPIGCHRDGLFYLLAHQMLAKSRECIGKPAGHEEPWRVARDETNRVADYIGPKPGAGGNCDRVIDTGLDLADPMPSRSRGIDFPHRHEFVENADVKHQAQPLAGADRK